MANTHFTVLPSEARDDTTPIVINFENNNNMPGLKMHINCTDITATPSVVFQLRGVDRTSGASYLILESAAIVATGLTVLTVYPGATPSANVTADTAIPDLLQLVATHGDTDSITYSVSVSFVS